jgi:hypothetical protein
VITHSHGTPERTAIQLDFERIRAELRDRLDRLDEATQLRALRQLAHDDPDAVNEALDAEGAAS